MNKIKFKKKKFFLSIKSVLLITTIISIGISFLISKKLSIKTVDYIQNVINENNNILYSNAYNKASNNFKTDELINVIKNKNDEILYVDFNIDKVNILLDDIVNNIKYSFDSYIQNGYVIYVPLGFITDNALYINYGPKVPFKVNIVGSALGNARTKLVEYGINNALVEVYVDIEMNIVVAMPFKSERIKYNYSSLIYSKLISGKVPTFYGGETISKTKTFDIPFS